MTSVARGDHAYVLSPVERCRRWRLRILEVSLRVQALHIAPAFSCLEITDAVYFDLFGPQRGDEKRDVFLMSKGHGCMAQYVILESLGVLTRQDLDDYCTDRGILGVHPDIEVPGVAASTGSLGHGLAMAVGMSHAENLLGTGVSVFCLLSDGELQEGSTWEAMMMAANLELRNLVAFVDLNDFGGLERMSEGHPAFYPVSDKGTAFGWEVVEVDGHDNQAIVEACRARQGSGPLLVLCRTIKGKGVSFMENEPIWHYRAPSQEEYLRAVRELGGSSS